MDLSSVFFCFRKEKGDQPIFIWFKGTQHINAHFIMGYDFRGKVNMFISPLYVRYVSRQAGKVLSGKPFVFNRNVERKFFSLSL